MNSELTIENFREISVSEQEGINGGGVLPLIGALAIVIIEEVVKDWDNFKNGLTGKPEEK